MTEEDYLLARDYLAECGCDGGRPCKSWDCADVRPLLDEIDSLRGQVSWLEGVLKMSFQGKN